MLYKLFSYISTITSFSGLYFIICLQSSEPIEPPPPVTNTTLFSIKFPMFLLSNFIGSLPNKSSISTFLKFCIKVLFFIKSAVPGNILTLAPVFWQISSICFLFSADMLDIAKNIKSTFCSLHIRSISNLVPITLLPTIL